MFADLAYAMAQGGEAGGQGGGAAPLFTMAIIFMIFYFLLMRPQQKKLKEHKSFLDSIKKGDDVITNGGILGKVVGVTDKVLTLEVGEKIKIKVLKSSIASSQKGTNNQE